LLSDDQFSGKEIRGKKTVNHFTTIPDTGVPTHTICQLFTHTTFNTFGNCCSENRKTSMVSPSGRDIYLSILFGDNKFRC
jgi:hypothetical protein